MLMHAKSTTPRREAPPPPGETPEMHVPQVRVAFKAWSHILSLMSFPPSTPNFEETPTVAIEQGGAAEAAIDGVNETIDSVTDTMVVLVADWFPGGEMGGEQ